MKYTVRFSRKSEADLFDLYDYIAASSGNDRTFPHRGARWSVEGFDIRVVGFERRVSIAFRIASDQVMILRILHGGRDIVTALGEPS